VAVGTFHNVSFRVTLEVPPTLLARADEVILLMVNGANAIDAMLYPPASPPISTRLGQPFIIENRVGVLGLQPRQRRTVSLANRQPSAAP
jgi:hypothetical protein